MWIARVILGSLWIFLLSTTEVKGQCTKPTTTENAVIHEDDIQNEEFPDQSTIRLKCHPGYEPTKASPRRLTCDAGQWTPEPERFTCQKKTCSNPGDITGGYYDFPEGNEFGSTIQAKCKPGYYILGSKSRTCMANGEWDGQPPVCEAVKCGAPPEISNGRLKLPPEDEYESGNMVEYDCEKGYTLFGDNSIHCLQNGTWSNGPRCTVVDCKRLDIPNARRIEGNSGPYGHRDQLKYECVEGYRMAGTTRKTGTVRCLEMGWSPPTLVCEEITCPQVKSTNASITEGDVGPYRPGSVIRYLCQGGDTLVGSPVLTCGLDGRWSSDPPVCGMVMCPAPEKTNATITSGEGGPYTVNSVLKYECPDGTTMIGNNQLTCQPDGQWSSNPPVCKQVKPIPVWLIVVIVLVIIGLVLAVVYFFFFWKKKSHMNIGGAAKRENIKLNPDP